MRKILILVLICNVVLLAGYAGFRGYKVWRQGHMMSLAHRFLARSDERNALLCLGQVLRSNPHHLEACRLMARLADSARSPSAVLWRHRVLELNPASLEDQLALAQSALMLRDYATAAQALEAVSEANRSTAGYQNVAGTVAAAANKLTEAETHFLEATQLEPTNPVPVLNLAVVRLQQTNAVRQAQARTALQELCANVRLRSQALRELARDAMRQSQTNEALALTATLLEQTNATLGDRLLRLEVVHQSASPEFPASLAGVQQQAAQDPHQVAEVATWQLAKLGPADTRAWLGSLPPSIQTNAPVTLVAAQCQLQLRDWAGFQAVLAPSQWGELEFLRHAWLCRAMREQSLSAAAQTEWDQSVKLALAQKERLILLLRLVVTWNWRGESQELLWRVVDQYPAEQWAARALAQVLFADGQTRSLLLLYSQQLKRSPADLDAKNNLAMAALLLDAQEWRPHELARQVYQVAPTNAAFASTYAFSLHLQAKHQEALQVLQQLPPAELQHSSIRGYYGLVLQAVGQSAQAKACLEAACTAPLLPEERKLFERAKAGG